jgi:glycosyltransferase involved in cell wall biosynthesis
MNVHFNTMVKNEGLLLDSILPLWKEYPIDKFVFYDDNSTDNTLDVIDKHLPKDRYVVLNDRLTRFHEAHHRSRMLEYSRESEADIVMSVDADEILSKNLEEDLHPLLREYEKFDILLYWYNVVENSLGRIRQDPLYKENYRSFILPMNKTKKFDLSLWKYHTPRVPSVDLPKMITKRYGVIHLQSMNERYYALKQLWYKHHEFVEYRHPVQQINAGYDPVVNNLNFQSIDTPSFIVGNMSFDSSIFDKIEKVKGYKDYILQNFNQDLVTFGQKYAREINENI